MQLETEIKTAHGTIQPIKDLKNRVFKFSNEQVVANFQTAMMFRANLKDSPSRLEKCIRKIEKNFEGTLNTTLIKNDRISLKKTQDTIVDKGDFFSVGYHHYCDIFIKIVGIGNWSTGGKKTLCENNEDCVKKTIDYCQEVEEFE